MLSENEELVTGPGAGFDGLSRYIRTRTREHAPGKGQGGREGGREGGRAGGRAVGEGRGGRGRAAQQTRRDRRPAERR